MTKYVSGIVQRASPNVGEGRIRPAGRSLGTPDLKNQPCFMNVTSEHLMAQSTAFLHKDAVAKVLQVVARVFLSSSQTCLHIE